MDDEECHMGLLFVLCKFHIVYRRHGLFFIVVLDHKGVPPPMLELAYLIVTLD